MSMTDQGLQDAAALPHRAAPHEAGAPVLVTGAGGFIGGHVVRALSASGHAVRAGLRQPGAKFGQNVETATADITDPAEALRALQSCRAVVHAASGAPEVIEQGTKAVLDAALAQGTRVIHLSSVSVYGAGDGSFDESTAVPRALDGYGGAKARAEALCHAHAAQGGDVVILRPGIVTGSGSTLWVRDIAARFAKGGATDLGAAGEGWSEPIHWRDLCGAIEAVLALPAPVEGQTEPRIYNVSGQARLSWNDYLTRLAAALGYPARRATGLEAKLAVLGKIARKAGLSIGPPTPTRAEMAVFARRADFPTAKLQADTGWRAGMSLDDIFDEIATDTAVRAPKTQASE